MSAPRWALLAALALGLTACRGAVGSDGDDDDDDTTTTDPAEVKEACADYVDAICGTKTTCDSTVARADCIDDLRDAGIVCERAAKVEPAALDTCLTTLETIDCELWFEEGLPEICIGAVKFEQI